jgi:hypothetical protein
MKTKEYKPMSRIIDSTILYVGGYAGSYAFMDGIIHSFNYFSFPKTIEELDLTNPPTYECGRSQFWNTDTSS